MACKLTPEQKEEIRNLITQGQLTYAEIGQRYGVGKSNISQIANGRNKGKNRPWTRERLDELWLMRKIERKSWDECSQYFKVSYQGLLKALKEYEGEWYE